LGESLDFTHQPNLPASDVSPFSNWMTNCFGIHSVAREMKAIKIPGAM